MDDPLPVVTLPTERQMRALHAGFASLGYGRRSDRGDRLRLAAETLGMAQLDSFNDLTAGQTGYLLGMLRCGDLPAAGAAYREPELKAGAAALPQHAARQAKSRLVAAAADVAAIGVVITWAAHEIRQHLAVKLALLSDLAAAQTGLG